MRLIKYFEMLQFLIDYNCRKHKKNYVRVDGTLSPDVIPNRRPKRTIACLFVRNYSTNRSLLSLFTCIGHGHKQYCLLKAF